MFCSLIVHDVYSILLMMYCTVYFVVLLLGFADIKGSVSKQLTYFNSLIRDCLVLYLNCQMGSAKEFDGAF